MKRTVSVARAGSVPNPGDFVVGTGVTGVVTGVLGRVDGVGAGVDGVGSGVGVGVISGRRETGTGAADGVQPGIFL